MKKDNNNRSVLFKQLGDDSVFTINLDSLLQKNYSIEKEDISKALDNNDVSTLRHMSEYFYSYSGIYKHLIHKVASIHYYRNILVPQFYVSKNEKFNKKVDKDVMSYYEKCNVENTCYNIVLLSVLYGSCSTYETITGDGRVVQQILPAEYCRSKSKDEFDNNIVEFNFQFFDTIINTLNEEESMNLWDTLPEEFENLYENYRNGISNCNDSRSPQWQMLDPKLSRCTMSTVNGSPLFANMFSDILDYEDYKTIDITKAKQKIFKLVAQTYPLDDEGEPKCDDGIIIDAHKNLKNVVDGVAGSLTTPFKLESVSLDDKSTSQEIKYAEQSVSNLYNSSGTQQSVMGSLDGSGANAIAASNTLLASTIKYIVCQLENWYNKKVNEVSNGNVVYKFKILDIHVFNEKDAINNYKQQLDSSGSVLAYASAIGIGQNTYQSLIHYENILGIKEVMKPILNSNQTSSKDISNNKKDDSEKSDETIRTENSRN